MAPVKKRRTIWQLVRKSSSTNPPSHSAAKCSFGRLAGEDHAAKDASVTLVRDKSSRDRKVVPTEQHSETSDCTSSTDVGSVSGLDASNDSSSESCSPRPTTDKFTKDELLRARRHLLVTGEISLSERDPHSLKTQRNPCVRSTDSAGSADAVDNPRPRSKCPNSDAGSRLPPASANSWASIQRQRRQCQDLSNTDGDGRSTEEIMRQVKGILNKLTPEKFSTLYTKLIESGVCDAGHMEMLAHVIFEEAVTQHNFSGLYADLCMYLLGDLSEDISAVFTEKVLANCMALLEGPEQQRSCDDAPLGTQDSAVEIDPEAQALQKKRSIGNVRFIGELLIRYVLPAEILFTCTTHLMGAPTLPHKLEMLAALLTVVGPVLDTAMWPQHAELVPVFWYIRGLTFDTNIPKRIRCLLRDVVELRDAMWFDGSSGKQKERPMMLDEVRHGSFQESQMSSAEWMAMAQFSEEAYGSWDIGNSMDHMDYMPQFAEEEGLQCQLSPTSGYNPSPSLDATAAEFIPNLPEDASAPDLCEEVLVVEDLQELESTSLYDGKDATALVSYQ